MRKTIATLIFCSSIYGFSIGIGDSFKYAARNTVKFPLLLLVTAAVCWVAYYIAARSLTVKLGFFEVQHLVLENFRDTSALLASLSPVFFFLAYTYEKPNLQGLCEYPLFLSLNVLFIPVCGSFSLVRQTLRLLKGYALSARRSSLIILSWMFLSLFVGGQWAWYLRPFCGVATLDAPFMRGSTADYNGSTNIYQALYNLTGPDSSRGYLKRLTRGRYENGRTTTEK